MNQAHRSSPWFQQLVTLGIIGLFLVVVCGVAGVRELRRAAHREVTSLGKANEQALAAFLEAQLGMIDICARVIAGSPLLRPATEPSPTPVALANANQTLDRYQQGYGTAVCYLMNAKGMVIASSNRNEKDNFVGKDYSFRPYFQNTLKEGKGHYFALGVTSGKRGFYSAAAVKDEQGNLRGVVVIKKDLDELATFFHAYPGAFLVDPNGVILLSSNPQWVFHTMRPFSEAEKLALKASRQFGDRPFPQAPIAIGDFKKGGAATLEGERLLVSAQSIGSDGWTLVMFNDLSLVDAYVYAGVSITSVVFVLIAAFMTLLIFRDRAVMRLGDQNARLVELLEKLKQSELAEREMQAQLLHAQKLESVGRLAAGIAHEINTPIQFVGDNLRFLQESFVGLTDLIQKSREFCAGDSPAQEPEERTRQLKGIFEAGDLDYLVQEVPKAIHQSLGGIQRVAEIVLAMKDFSHPDQKEKAPLDLNRAIETTAVVSRNEWKLLADLELHLDPELPLVPGFLGDISQVLLNLIVNAAHAIESKTKGEGKGLITISTKACPDAIEIRIADSGGGIKEEHRGHIFDPFFTTKELGKGTGQGLTLAYNILVKKHGGSLSFDTETGLGTTFTIRLPLAKAQGDESTRR
jgi:C4-dicarboxylate-specific signal transduction histidine kinase